MLMNVQPIATVSERINEVRALTARIVNKEILPNENLLWARHTNVRLTPDDVEQSRELREHVKSTVKQAGLWAPHLPVEYGGAGLDFLELAYMNEVLAYAVGAASLFGVVAPNSGNQTILVKYGTEEQKRKWLIPLIEGTLESGFSMTEPDQPGSDPRSLRTTAQARRRRVGDQWPQVVHVERHAGRLLHRHVPYRGRPRRQRREQPHDPDHRPTRHARREHRPRYHGVGRRKRSLRDHLRRRPCADRQPARQSRERAPGRPGPPRRRARLPLHELDRPDVARVRPDGRARDGRARSTAGCWRPSSSSRDSSPTPTSTSRPRDS